jgi:elongator complex protein 1
LEAIEPRALMVYYIRQLLADYQYGQAFTMMRRHRIDLNFFYDNNPRVFLDHLKDFVEQVDNIEYLNLFISALRDEDVTKTIFIDPWFKPELVSAPALPVAPVAPAVANTIAGITGPIPAASQIRLPQLSAEPAQNKINLICNALRDVFQTLNPNKYLLPILTTYVTKNPQEIEAALKLVQGLKNAGNEAKSDALTAEKALKYLIFLVDVNKLYDIALGMYDFDLMMMVAQKSQKDPKEYIPFLTKLKGQEVNYQRYSIDMTLGRYDKALGHLSKAGADYFNECVELMKKYKLYSKALDIFSDNSTNNDNPQMKVIMDAYGEYLFEERKLEEAANIWSSNKNWQRALDTYKEIPDWRNALVMAKRLQKSAEDTTTLIKDIAYKYTEVYKWDDAGILYEKINAIEDAVNSYASGHSWEDAVRLSVLNDHEEWIEEKIKPALLLTAERLKEGLEKSLKKITKRYNRLIELRYEKMTQPRMEEDPTNLEESMSVYSSEASSMASGYSSISSTSSRLSTTSSQMSRGSNRSNRSKNSARKQNRKASRKKVSGRRGTPHEEEYILQRIGELFPTEKFQKEVANTLKNLVTFGYRTEAKALQQAMTTFLTAVDATLPLLNTPSPKTPAQLHEDEEKLAQKIREGKLTTEAQLINKLIDPVNIPKIHVEKVDWRVDYI